MNLKFKSFKEFYPYYLSEHQNKTCQRLHLIGSLGGLVIFIIGLITHIWPLLLAGPLFGYGCAWIGHFCFEKNKPTTYKWPLYSFIGDWALVWSCLKNFRKP